MFAVAHATHLLTYRHPHNSHRSFLYPVGHDYAHQMP